MKARRQNSKLRTVKGAREETEEELLPEAFDSDFEQLSRALRKIEAYRMKVINWLYPDV